MTKQQQLDRMAIDVALSVDNLGPDSVVPRAYKDKLLRSWGELPVRQRPIQDVVIIRPAVVNDTTPGGIVIPQKAKLKTCEGEVVAVGPGSRSRKTGTFTPTELQPGDCVLYEQGRGIRVDYQGEKLLFMREPDVVGVLPEGPQGNTYDPYAFYEQDEIAVGGVRYGPPPVTPHRPSAGL